MCSKEVVYKLRPMERHAVEGHKRYLHKQCCVNISHYVLVRLFFLMFAF